jgi:predicted nucleotide-binding protein
MSKNKRSQVKKLTKTQGQTKQSRNFPFHSLEETLVLPQKIQDEMAGKPMNRLLLAEALGVSPSSSNFRNLLSSSYKYGLTEGTEKADQISLTEIGNEATQTDDQSKRLKALRSVSLKPEVFGRLFGDYSNKRVPSNEMMPKILNTQYGVPAGFTSECASIIVANGKYVDLIRDIGGSPHILIDADFKASASISEKKDEQLSETPEIAAMSAEANAVHSPPRTAPADDKVVGHRPIFVGHGKNKAPLQQLEKLLTAFQIPHKVVVNEANLGRPISQKVKETIQECGSAILIFTRDELFYDENKKEIWRPSENIVHELGATSFAYGDRIVIFKEKGLHFPSNFQSIGYIEFEIEDIQARTADLLKELIGFGLVRVTPT